MQNSWIVLLPPIVVLLLAFTTHRIIFSLLSGIITAAFIATNFLIWPTIQTVINRIWTTSELGALGSWHAFKNNWNLFICLFLLMLGAIIVLVNHSGGAFAYGKFIKKKLHSKKSAETASLSLSLLFFIDDHFSSLTVGSVMHPLTDKFKIPRAKLAFLVDAMAAPLCILAPISSWVAYIVMQLKKSGISNVAQKGTYILADPFFIYTKSIPFIFYSIIAIISVWFIARRRISIGLMNKHEKIASETGNLSGGKKTITKKIKEIHEENKNKANMLDFLLPILTLIISVVISLLYLGDYTLFGGTNSFMESIRNSKSANALFNGGLITLSISLIYFIIKKRFKLKQIPAILWEGFELMGSCIIVLVLAWTLSGLLKDDLGTGQYLANLLLGHVSIVLLPLLFFVVTSTTAITMGSAWGSMAVIIPIAIPMLLSFLQLSIPATIENLNILFPVLGAILSGAVSGNHLSPVSDTTIMSAASSGCKHMDHVRTQHTYAFPILFSTGIAFLVSGFLYHYNVIVNITVSLGVGIIFNFTYLEIKNFLRIKKG